MEAKRRDTLRKLVDANADFSSQVCEGKIQGLALYVKFELALLFFKLHEDELASLDDADRSCVCSLMDSSSYVLEGNFVFVDGKLYELGYVVSLVDKVKRVRREVSSDKVICVDFRSNEDEELLDLDCKERVSSKDACKVYDIRNMLRDTTFTYEERAYILERTTRLDCETRPFIDENQSRFVYQMSRLIKRLLAGEEVDVEDYNVSLLVAYLKMYPFVKYGKDLVFLEKLPVPQSEIGVAKCVIEDEFVFKLETYMRELQRERKEYVKQYFSFHDCEGKLKKLAEMAEARVQEIDVKLQDCSWSYYTYVHDVDVYNRHVLPYLELAFSQGNVYMKEDRGANPVVRFFTVVGEEITFFGAMHLDLFKTLIDSSKLLDVEDKKVLQKRQDSK